MRKRFLALFLAGALATGFLGACGQKPAPSVVASVPPGSTTAPAPTGDTVELTMGSWRADDVSQMNSLLAEYKKIAPNVNITFQPTNPSDYNATLRMQLEAGTAPDLLYARSHATGIELFESGYFADCTNLAGLTDNFTETNRDPWQTPDGKMFAVPFAAVSHAVYYNKDIFAANKLEVPNTWNEFLAVCKTLKDAGITPIANGVAEEWDILECLFLSMVPNYVGGADERAKYEAGEKAMNDKAFVDAYTDLAMLSPYLPNGFEAVTYNDSQVLFNTESAAMFVDGSWTAGVYESATFDWSVFAVPSRSGKDGAVVFHPDMAITMNAKTPYQAEATAFLEWLCTKEGATTASENLPVGYYPMIDFPIELADKHANEFLALNNGRITDARFVWPKLMDLYAPMNQEVIKVLKGDSTPQQAADAVQASYEALGK